MKNYARQLLLDAAKEGYTFQVGSEGEVDYTGDQPLKALEAVEAVEIADLYIIKDGKREWASIVPHEDGDEPNIVDHSCHTPLGFIEQWWDHEHRTER